MNQEEKINRLSLRRNDDSRKQAFEQELQQNPALQKS